MTVGAIARRAGTRFTAAIPLVFGGGEAYDRYRIICDHNSVPMRGVPWMIRSGDLDFSLASSLSSLIRELQLATAAHQIAVEDRIQMLLIETLSLLDQAFPGVSQRTERPSGRPAQLVAGFLRLAEAHCRDRWRLSDYARALHVSSGHLRATCVRVAGAPPVRLIHECLLREAKRRLIGSSLPIGAIALELGFQDAAYFSRLFHAKNGMSPQQYRLSFRQNAPTKLATTEVE
jgi:AraC family transcriptional regulator, transcriptional activator of pobA